jgi:shikimate kinase
VTRSVFLVGFMGAGKSSVGRQLASDLGWPFLDTDAEVERRSGRPIEAIFAEDGERRFRQLEWDVLERAACAGPAVIATGGGLFLGAGPRRWMKRTGVTVWLDVPLETCRARLGSGSGRPLASGRDSIDFRAFFERRRACYALAELVIPLPALGVPEAAALVAERVSGSPPRREPAEP